MKAKFLVVLTSALLALVGCGGSVTSQGIANVRGVSLTSSPAQVDIYSDFNLIGFGLSIGQVSPYSLQQANLLSVGVRQTGNTGALDSVNANFANATKYTVFAYPVGASALGLFILTDTTTAPAAGKFKLRLVHLDRLQTGVDVYFTDPDTDLTLESPVMQNVAFEDATAYVELLAGVSKQVRLTKTGTTTQVGSSINFTPVIGATQTLAYYDNSGPTVTLYTDN
jgi:hypothetical protein